MTVRVAANGSIELNGVCPNEDAEKLQQYLIADPHAPVDWRTCVAAHTSVLQILLAAKPVLHGLPAGDFLRDHIAPLMRRAGCDVVEGIPPR